MTRKWTGFSAEVREVCRYDCSVTFCELVPVDCLTMSLVITKLQFCVESHF